MTQAPVWLLLIPFTAALLALVLPSNRRTLLVWVTSALSLGAATWLAVEVALQGALRYAIGGWAAPVGIGLYADGLSAGMIIITSVVTTAASLYSLAYRQGAGDHEQRMYWSLWFFLWGALHAVFLAADLFNIYVVLEIVGLTGIGLIALTSSSAALTAAMRYMIVAFLGSLSFLMGVAMLYAEHHTLDLMILGGLVGGSSTSGLAFALIIVGMALKTALFPLHFWLPPAHAAAPAPVSAMLSALVVKASFFVLLRLWFLVFQEAPLAAVGQLLGLLGSVAIIWGSYQALQQRRIKMMIAHSTVAQVGYLFLLFPLTAGGAADADWFSEIWTGVSYHAMAHALAKASLFLCAGAITYRFGTDNLQSLARLSSRMPLVTLAVAAAGVSLIGLPPSGGFVAKWLIMKAVVASGQWWWLPGVVAGSLLTASYIFLILHFAFSEREGPAPQRSSPRMMEVTALVLALLAIAAGFRLEEPLNLLSIGLP